MKCTQYTSNFLPISFPLPYSHPIHSFFPTIPFSFHPFLSFLFQVHQEGKAYPPNTLFLHTLDGLYCGENARKVSSFRLFLLVLPTPSSSPNHPPSCYLSVPPLLFSLSSLSLSLPFLSSFSISPSPLPLPPISSLFSPSLQLPMYTFLSHCSSQVVTVKMCPAFV